MDPMGGALPRRAGHDSEVKSEMHNAPSQRPPLLFLVLVATAATTGAEDNVASDASVTADDFAAMARFVLDSSTVAPAANCSGSDIELCAPSVSVW